MSVYTLGIMGGGPVGSLLSGYLAEPLGLHGTLALDAGLATTGLVGTALSTRLLQLR